MNLQNFQPDQFPVRGHPVLNAFIQVGLFLLIICLI